MAISNKSTHKYTVTLDAVTARSVEQAARSLNTTITAYIRKCIMDRGHLLQKNSNLRARLNDVIKGKEGYSL